MTFKGHSRTQIMLVIDSTHAISYQLSIVSLSCTVLERYQHLNSARDGSSCYGAIQSHVAEGQLVSAQFAKLLQQSVPKNPTKFPNILSSSKKWHYCCNLVLLISEENQIGAQNPKILVIMPQNDRKYTWQHPYCTMQLINYNEIESDQWRTLSNQEATVAAPVANTVKQMQKSKNTRLLKSKTLVEFMFRLEKR